MTTNPRPRQVYHAAFVSYYMSNVFQFRLKLGFGNYEVVKVAVNGFEEMSGEAYDWFVKTLLNTEGELVVQLLKQDLTTGVHSANIYLDDQFINQRMYDLGFGEPNLSS